MISSAIGSPAGLGEVEQLADLVALALDLRGRRGLDPRDQVVDLEHLDVRARLRLDLREVGVHVEHPGVGVAEEAEARAGAGCARPPAASTQLARSRPRRVAVEQRAGDGRYGIRARVNAPASSGTQQAEQLASHSPVVMAS